MDVDGAGHGRDVDETGASKAETDVHNNKVADRAAALLDSSSDS